MKFAQQIKLNVHQVVVYDMNTKGLNFYHVYSYFNQLCLVFKPQVYATRPKGSMGNCKYCNSAVISRLPVL